jgi:protein SCO1/2
MYYCNKTLDLMGRRIALTLIIFLAIIFSPRPLMAEESNTVGQKTDAPEFTRFIVNYEVPDVAVVPQDGKKISFLKGLDDGRPVILNFVFVSCSAICPMLSHVLSKVQTKLDNDSQKVHLISISIDPESDTPAKLIEYAKKFGAGPDWDFYTGTREASIAIQKAFNAYRGDKMNHASVIFMRAAPGKPWLRLEGFVSPDAVIHEYRNMLQQQ